jgi:hypothetical protein
MVYQDIILTILTILVGVGLWRQKPPTPPKKVGTPTTNKNIPHRVEILKDGLHHHWTLEGSADHLEAINHPDLTIRVVEGEK